MRAFISGGAGFIGSHLSARLLAKGHSVLAYDNLSLGRLAFLEPLLSNAKFDFVNADLLDRDVLLRSLKGSDIVYHLAANSDISRGPDNNSVDFRNGTLATYQLLDAMRELKVARLVFASTSAVYGETHVHPTPEKIGPLFPISFYGASKLASEAMVSAFSHNCGIRSHIFRFANIVGGNATHGVIFDFVKKLRKQPAELAVLGDGSQCKSYLYIADCLDAIEFVLQHGRGRQERPEVDLFNLASRGVTRVSSIAEMVAQAFAERTGNRPELKYSGGDRGWRGDVPLTHIDGSDLEALGWRARLSSDEAVKQAIADVLLQFDRGGEAN